MTRRSKQRARDREAAEKLASPAPEMTLVRPRIVDLEQIKGAFVPKLGDVVAHGDEVVVVASEPTVKGRSFFCWCLVGTSDGWEEGGLDVRRNRTDWCFTNLYPVEQWPCAGFGEEALNKARVNALARQSNTTEKWLADR